MNLKDGFKETGKPTTDATIDGEVLNLSVGEITVKDGFKKTGVGVIPLEWEVKELGKIAFLKRGKFTPRPRNNPIYYGGNIPFVQTGDVTNSKGAISNYTQTLNQEGLAVSALFKKGTILMTIAANIGYAGILEIDMACPDSLVAIDGLENVDNTFLNHYFLFERHRLDSLSTSGAQKNLSIELLAPFEISLPPTLAEQTAIATALTETDALITGLEKLSLKKRHIKQGTMQKLLMPTEGWGVKKLGEIGIIVTGSTPPTQIKEYWNGTIPWITPTDISIEKDIYNSEREITHEGQKFLRKLPSNTLLVTCIASIGKNAILRNEGACNQQINAIIPHENFNVDFLYYLIENNKQYIIGKAGLTATLLISKKDFSEITFSLPKDKTEQTRIATILTDMDSEIAAIDKKLTKYKAIKQGMMQQLLTGAIRLV